MRRRLFVRGVVSFLNEIEVEVEVEVERGDRVAVNLVVGYGGHFNPFFPLFSLDRRMEEMVEE